MAHIYQRNFTALGKILDLESVKSGALESGKSRSGGYMDWTMDRLRVDERGRVIIAISHHYKQNGDMVPDPDMELAICFEGKTMEALTFQDCYGHKAVYVGDRKWRPQLSKELNAFLETWLRNLRNQGHKIGAPVGNTKRFETPVLTVTET